MAKTVKWTTRAYTVYIETAVYLEENFSHNAAMNFVNIINEKVEVLRVYPNLGRKVPKMKTLRFVLVGQHRRLYYRIDGSFLIISNIFDTRQHRSKDIFQ